MPVLKRWASVLASTVSVLTLTQAMALILNGLASISGMPALSKTSAVFIQWLPVDSHTALHWPYLALTLLANLRASSDVLPYPDSSSMSPSALTMHVTHFLFPMSIPILFSIFLTSFFLAAGRKLQTSIRALGPVTQQLGSPHSTTRSRGPCGLRGQLTALVRRYGVIMFSTKLSTA